MIQEPYEKPLAPVIAFFISLSICLSLTGFAVMNKTGAERLRLEQLALNQSIRINEVITKQLYKAHALSALVLQGEGRVKDFDRLASLLIDDATILNMLLAPGGVVSEVYPRPGNEAVIGLDFFKAGEADSGALAARDSGGLVLGGPLDLRQGGRGLVGRMPVYIDTPDEKRKFWGLVSVTLKFPQVLEATELRLLTGQGLSYELWRINPDTGQRQTIAGGFEEDLPESRFIERHIRILNADWYLKVWPLRPWYSHLENIGVILAGLLISVLILFVMQNNYDLKRMRYSLELLAQYDQLTGIYNRRRFMEISQLNLERSRRLNLDCHVVLFDIDHFKDINDTHGHAAGDEILRQVAARIKKQVRPYDVFARYGGEEFVIAVFDMDNSRMADMAERLRACIEREKFRHEGLGLQVTASFGVAAIVDFSLEKTIQNADEALYASKRAGRNRVSFYQG